MSKKSLTLFLLFCIANITNAQTLQTMKRLPDTGQTTSFTTTFGEDNDYNINLPSFINNNNGTITDTVTGLMWQSIDAGEMTIEKARSYCDTLTLGGFVNWRLPNAQEGFSILNLQNNNPALNTIYFPNTNAEYWWTSESQANDSNKIWVTNSGGGIGNHPKTETISAGGVKKFHARAVRDVVNPTTIAAHFTDNNDSTITDNITNLVWQKFPSTTTQTWEQALSFSENLVLANNTNWHLPNIKELQSLNDESLIQPSITAPYFANLGVKKYWSATSLPNQTTKAWYWDTQFGVTTYDTKTYSNLVLCVHNITSTPNAISSIKNTSEIIIAPNPFNDYLIFKNVNSKAIKIFDAMGKIIYAENIKTNFIKIETSNWIKGVYFVEVGERSYRIIKN
jgi:hypothetical protein